MLQTILNLGKAAGQFIVKNWVPITTATAGVVTGYVVRSNKTTIVNKTTQAKNATNGFFVRGWDKFTGMFKRNNPGSDTETGPSLS